MMRDKSVGVKKDRHLMEKKLYEKNTFKTKKENTNNIGNGDRRIFNYLQTPAESLRATTVILCALMSITLQGERSGPSSKTPSADEFNF